VRLNHAFRFEMFSNWLTPVIRIEWDNLPSSL